MIARNDNPGHRPTRRLRIDERPSAPQPEAAGRSGRLVVVAAGLTLMALGVVLALAFFDWRAHYRARVTFGALEVAPAIDPLARIVPDGVDPEVWRRAVADTHRLLVAAAAANLFDLAGLRALRAQVVRQVARARPESARDELAGLWDDLTARAGPILDKRRHPRPALLSPPR